MAVLFPVLIWWLIIEILGLVALPVAFRLFRNLPDRGYAFAKPLGLLLTSYVFWILVTFGFLGNTRSGIGFVLLLLAIGGAYLFSQDREELLGFWRRNRGLVIAGEALFALAFGLWALFRAYNPEIMATEKPMEIGFLNAILRSQTFPPHDPWLSGFAISYYYFGYLMMAMLTRLSGLGSNITFNLANALLFALTVTGAYGLVYNLVKGAREQRSPSATLRTGKGAEEQGKLVNSLTRYLVPLLGSLFVVVVGNLEGLLELLHAKGIGSTAFWEWIDIKNLASVPTSPTWYPLDNWWWWRASRVVKDRLLGVEAEVIDEFPFFSFMLGDMHPHVLALPFTFLALALALNVVLSSKRQAVSSKWQVSNFQFLISSLCLGALGFLNSWDFPTYSLIFIAAYAIQRYLIYGKVDRHWLKEVLYRAVWLGGLGVFLYLPFYVGFQSQAGGLRPVLLVKTRLHQYLVMFGLFIFVIAGFLSTQLGEWIAARRKKGWLTAEVWLIGGVSLPLMLVFLLFQWWTSFLLIVVIAFTTLLLFQKVRLMAIKDSLLSTGHPTSNLQPFGLSASADASAEALKAKPPASSLLFILLLIVVGLGLTLSVEFVYLKDVFNSRMNTVFKFYYQAWVLLAISAAFGVYYMANGGWRMADSQWRSVGRYAWLGLFAALFAASLVYPIAATYTKANRFAVSPTLDGTAWMRQSQADDYAAMQWLQANVEGAPVILEATGGSYSAYGRISAYTGLPTLLGWGGHELQWRGNYDEPGKREPVIATIYQSLDRGEVERLLGEYDITYVYVGSLERQKYELGEEQVAKFARFMDVAYERGEVIIYKRR